MKVTDCTVKYDLEGRCELCFTADRQSLQECRETALKARKWAENGKLLELTVKPFRKRRSLDANAYLQTFVFHKPLTNEPPASAGSGARMRGVAGVRRTRRGRGERQERSTGTGVLRFKHIRHGGYGTAYRRRCKRRQRAWHRDHDAGRAFAVKRDMEELRI